MIVNISKAHQLIALSKKDCQPYKFISQNPFKFQTLQSSNLTKLFYKSLSLIARIVATMALVKNYSELEMAIPINFILQYISK